MMVLTINNKENKGMEEAIKVLKENGFDVEQIDALKQFCKDEAYFRIHDMDVLTDEEKNMLTEEEMNTLENVVADEYFERDIFEYAYMDAILREEYKDIMISK